ncbi:MAG: ArsR/SmtB family transcription factor [Rectinemataceae bacterium]
MTAKQRDRLEHRAALLRALAHPSRLLIIELLEKEPRTVADLTKAIGSDKTTVSKHLTVLKKVGLVRAKKRGTWSDYELVCGCVSHFINCLESGIDAKAMIV